MDSDAIELLFRQNFCTAKDFVKMLYDTIKDKMRTIKSENDELKQSLEYTQGELHDERKTLEQQRKQDRQNETSGGNYNLVAERVISLEDHSRRQNVIVESLEKRKDESEEML